jgi:hypothetical protein
MTIIGITGKKGSGKDTVGELLAKEFGKQYYCQRLSAGDHIKEELARLTGGKRETVDKNKNNPVIRFALQTLGEDQGRWYEKLGEDIENWKKKTALPLFFYQTDLRYVIGANWIKERGGLIIKVERKSLENNDPHPSEVEQDRIHPDFTVDNNSGLTRLGFEVKCVAAFIRERINIKL